MRLTFRIKKSSDFIFEYLSDMQKFVSVHPIIFQIDALGDENYLVHERLKFGFIPLSFTYPVVIEKDALTKMVILRATVMKLTKIELKFWLRPDNEFTVIDEEIQIKSPLPLKFVMEKIFRKQHNQLFKNMELK